MNWCFENCADNIAIFPPKAVMPCIKGLSAMAPMLKITKVASMCFPCARGFGVSGLTSSAKEATSGSKGGGKDRKYPALAGRPKTCFCAGVRFSNQAHSATGWSALYQSDAKVKGGLCANEAVYSCFGVIIGNFVKDIPCVPFGVCERDAGTCVLSSLEQSSNGSNCVA